MITLKKSLQSSYLKLPEENREQWEKKATIKLCSDIPESFSTAKELAQQYLTEEIKEQIQQINQPRGPKYLLLKNLPIDRVIPSLHTDNKPFPSKLTQVSEQVIIGTAGAANVELFSYYEQKAGRLIQDVIPIQGLENSNSNASAVKFGWHSDDAILKREYRVEGIILFCLLNSGQTITWFAPIDEIVKAMDSYYVAILCEPRYRVRTPESFNCFGNKIICSELRPVITKDVSGEYEIAVALYNVQTQENDEEAKIALNVLRSVLKPPVAKAITLEPGDLLLLSNVKGLHARDSITSERWLQRAYFRKSLVELRCATESEQDSRVFSSEELVIL